MKPVNSGATVARPYAKPELRLYGSVALLTAGGSSQMSEAYTVPTIAICKAGMNTTQLARKHCQ